MIDPVIVSERVLECHRRISNTYAVAGIYHLCKHGVLNVLSRDWEAQAEHVMTISTTDGSIRVPFEHVVLKSEKAPGL